jgi:hypothetical protein
VFKVLNECIDITEGRACSGGGLSVGFELAGLPFGRPEPRLIGGYRHVWPQDDLAIAFDDLELRAGLIKPKAGPKLWRQGDCAPLLDRHEG